MHQSETTIKGFLMEDVIKMFVVPVELHFKRDWTQMYILQYE